ncbi:MAG: hypothetical protein M0033_01230 [Nitrospiraceae bacterium]|nr:hypothetical protein [Nitrospiraceae bacterium]MDA8324817.1 hypothetical protein [Nitrospiraceae bacterium]
MTIFPFQMKEMMHLYTRALKLPTSVLLEKDQAEPKDVVMISSEAKKKQVLDEAKGAVLERIRQAR